MRTVGVLSALAMLFNASLLYAKLCGDNVQGQDVPCACGDTVVSNVVLTDDPVTSTVCSGDGLIVRAPEAVSGITIDLNGKTLRGSGQGAGLWVVYGGPGGARLVSSGQAARLQGFRDGVVSQGNDSLFLLDSVVVAQSRRDGVRVQGNNYSIHATEVIASGRDGFALSGHDFQVTATSAVQSARYGYIVMGQRTLLGMPAAGITSQGSGNAGISLGGMVLSLNNCVVTGAAKNGVQLSGMDVTVDGCTATDNAETGIIGDGIRWTLHNNQAARNGHDGLVVRGATDEGGNRGLGNGIGQHLHRPAVQCTINGVPCEQ